MLEPKDGLITFRSEGNNIPKSIFFTRVIHWPGNIRSCSSSLGASGVTIGRGYDMKHRYPSQIIHDLTRSGIPHLQAKKISLGARLHHCSALDFVNKNREIIGEITESQQLKLFEITYSSYVSDAKRFYARYRSSTSLDWGEIDLRIRDIFIDLKYQGLLQKIDVLEFESNNINNVIKFIKESPKIMYYEKNRKRINYLTGDY